MDHWVINSMYLPGIIGLGNLANGWCEANSTHKTIGFTFTNPTKLLRIPVRIWVSVKYETLEVYPDLLVFTYCPINYQLESNGMCFYKSGSARDITTRGESSYTGRSTSKFGGYTGDIPYYYPFTASSAAGHPRSASLDIGMADVNTRRRLRYYSPFSRNG
jgi:hypothetical protein